MEIPEDFVEDHIVFNGTPYVAEVFVLFARAYPHPPDPRDVSDVFMRAITAQLQELLPPGSIVNATVITQGKNPS